MTTPRATAGILLLLAVFAVLGGCVSAPDSPYPCADDSTCRDSDVCVTGVGCVGGTPCDAFDSSMCSTAEKCSLMPTPFGQQVGFCRAPGPDEGQQACTRDATGADSCDVGLVCDATTSTDGAATCKPLCTTGGCAQGTSCVIAPGTGDELICAPPCTLETACSNGRTCRPASTVPLLPLTCTADGVASLGALCDELTSCAAGLLCSPAFQCVTACDATHVCSAGVACQALSNTESSSYGYCAKD